MEKSNKELWSEMYRLCEETEIKKSGMEYLVKYYLSEGWTEEKALTHAIGLFHNGTIAKIKLLNKDGEEI